MTLEPRAECLARRFIDARKTGRKITPEEVRAGPRDLDEAYLVQALTAEALGPTGAFKTGRKSPDAKPIMAPIPAFTVRQSPAVFGRDELWLIGIELEIGFRIDAPLPSPDDPDFEARARGCVSALAALEVVDTRLADHESAGPLLKLADNQINGGLVVGAPRRDWRSLDLARVDARLRFGDEVVLDGSVDVPGGDAFATFCVFARQVGTHCGGLQPGQFVITGSVNGLPFIERGTSVHGEIAGLGEVAADFTL